MHEYRRLITVFVLTGITAILTLVGGCASHAPMEKYSPMDSPAHHVMMGSQFAQGGDAVAAMSSYRKAVELHAEYAPAYAGKARVHARKGNREKALAAVSKARQTADSTSEKVDARLAEMAVLGRDGLPDDMPAMEKAYDYIEDNAPGHPEAALMMARAYEGAGRNDKAKILYRRIIEADGPWAADAERAWEKMQTRHRLESDVRATEELADLPELTRAQTAALIVEELDSCRLLEKVRENQPVAAFRTPRQEREAQAATAVDIPVDVKDHPLRQSIALAIGMNLRGLQVRPDGRFYPDAAMLRADMALALEDLLVIAENDVGLSRKFIGSSSPFSDVQADSYVFNAVVVTTTRGLMQAPESRRFFPQQPVSGMDALKSIQRIRSRLE